MSVRKGRGERDKRRERERERGRERERCIRQPLRRLSAIMEEAAKVLSLVLEPCVSFEHILSEVIVAHSLIFRFVGLHICWFLLCKFPGAYPGAVQSTCRLGALRAPELFGPRKREAKPPPCATAEKHVAISARVNEAWLVLQRTVFLCASATTQQAVGVTGMRLSIRSIVFTV